jgi:hypothetical protein
MESVRSNWSRFSEWLLFLNMEQQFNIAQWCSTKTDKSGEYFQDNKIEEISDLAKSEKIPKDLWTGAIKNVSNIQNIINHS